MPEILERKAIIRKAILEDIDNSINLLREFKEESTKEYGIDINEGMIRDTVSRYINSSFVAEIDGRLVGILAGYTTFVPMVTSPIFQEEVWYVSKAYRLVGVRLLKHLEGWCKQNGVSHIIMSSLTNSKHRKLQDFYIRQGYVPLQMSYVKLIDRGN